MREGQAEKCWVAREEGGGASTRMALSIITPQRSCLGTEAEKEVRAESWGRQSLHGRQEQGITSQRVSAHAPARGGRPPLLTHLSPSRT